jgi:hypothetical protein
MTPSFPKVDREFTVEKVMLQINNILSALAEAKHSLDEIIEFATGLPANCG